jgi:hypothetical protein
MVSIDSCHNVHSTQLRPLTYILNYSEVKSIIDARLCRQIDSGKVNQWKTVDEVYHATNNKALSFAEETQTLKYDGPYSTKEKSCSLFMCNCGNDGGRPTISPMQRAKLPFW